MVEGNHSTVEKSARSLKEELTSGPNCSIFRAMLGASLAVKIHQPPIRSMEELVVSDLSVRISQGTSVYEYFATAKTTTPQYELFHKKIKGHEDPSSPDEMEVLTQMAQGDLSPFIEGPCLLQFIQSTFLGLLPKSVLIGVYQPLSVSQSYPCQVRSLPKDFRTVGNGLVFRKHWPYTELFNHYLLEAGILTFFGEWPLPNTSLSWANRALVTKLLHLCLFLRILQFCPTLVTKIWGLECIKMCNLLLFKSKTYSWCKCLKGPYFYLTFSSKFCVLIRFLALSFLYQVEMLQPKNLLSVLCFYMAFGFQLKNGKSSENWQNVKQTNCLFMTKLPFAQIYYLYHAKTSVTS